VQAIGLSAALPVPPAPLIGRERELAFGAALLGTARLVTLVGAAGCGKTRLAVELAQACAVDPVFVDLAPLRDAGEVLPAIARGLGLPDAGAQPLSITVHHHLRERRPLLLLDNVEHLLAARSAADDVAALLAAAAGVRVLATSRAPLQVPGEQLLPVDPLPVPDLRALPAVGELGATASVALFLARVRAAQPTFVLTEDNCRIVAEICLALDGLPLALELAAARVRAFGLAEVLAGTRARFELLTTPRRAVPDRHRSLTNAVRWSVDLLDAASTELFAELSVFTGGWTSVAAHAVCGREVQGALAELVDQSLVVVEATPTGVRYRMLDTLREYAAGLLDERGSREELQRRHLQWCVEFAERGAEAFLRRDEHEWLDRAEAEFDNFQAALNRSRSPEAQLRLATALSWFWDLRGHLTIGRAHLERLLTAPADAVLRGRALRALGRFAMNQDDHSAARAALQQSRSLARAAGDGAGVVWACALLTISAVMTGDADLADSAAAESAAVAPALPPFSRGQSLFTVALARWLRGDAPRARDAYAESEIVDPDVGAWLRGRGIFFVGWFHHLDGDDARAEALQRESVALLGSIGDRRSIVDALDVLGCVAARRGDVVAATRRFAVARRIRAETGLRRHRYLDEHVIPIERSANATLGPAADRVVAQSQSISAADVLAEPNPPATLTLREEQVAQLVAEGLTNRQIGRRLGISERTAERHVENLRAKLGMSSRAQVAAWVAAGIPMPRL
jgi:predicted ATPase/DNA-binding CsgD family transcriptional regulator